MPGHLPPTFSGTKVRMGIPLGAQVCDPQENSQMSSNELGLELIPSYTKARTSKQDPSQVFAIGSHAERSRPGAKNTTRSETAGVHGVLLDPA